MKAGITCHDCRALADGAMPDDHRPDPDALRAHLAGCAACRSEYPELAWLTAAVETAPKVVARPRPHLARAAAAVVLITIGALALLEMPAGPGGGSAGDPGAREDHSQLVEEDASQVAASSGTWVVRRMAPPTIVRHRNQRAGNRTVTQTEILTAQMPSLPSRNEENRR